MTVVDARVPVDSNLPITIISDTTFPLQEGERASALAFLHQRCADYLRENGIGQVVIKASALPTGPAKLALLESAEVRGVVIAASASLAKVKMLSKAVISRTFGDRKVDEYLKDDGFWDERVEGESLRKTSREAAMLIIASRER